MAPINTRFTAIHYSQQPVAVFSSVPPQNTQGAGNTQGSGGANPQGGMSGAILNSVAGKEVAELANLRARESMLQVNCMEAQCELFDAMNIQSHIEANIDKLTEEQTAINKQLSQTHPKSAAGRSLIVRLNQIEQQLETLEAKKTAADVQLEAKQQAFDTAKAALDAVQQRIKELETTIKNKLDEASGKTPVDWDSYSINPSATLPPEEAC